MKLSVNIDHIATIRQARMANEPDPVYAAVLAEMGGADGITVHLRQDRRHIQERDVEILRRVIKTKLNMEMAVSMEMVKIALKYKPDVCTLVPESKDEITTSGGLDVDHVRRQDPGSGRQPAGRRHRASRCSSTRASTRSRPATASASASSS